MDRSIKWKYLVFLLVLTLFLGSCGKAAVRMTLYTGANLNPDENGAPLPVVVRVYQLTAEDRFQNAQFIELWQDDARVLGDQLITTQEITLYPNSESELELETGERTKYVGVVGLFRQIEGSSWREVVEVTKKRQKVYVYLEGQRLEASAKKRKK